MIRVLLPLLLLTTAPLPADAQVATPEQVARRASDRDHWVDAYTQTVAAETEGLRRAGLGSAWEAIRGKVARHLQPREYSNASPAAHNRLRAAHIASTTNFIVRIGYRPENLAHPAQARTIVRAADITNWGDADALILTAPTVFVADFVRLDWKPDNSADLVFRVREPIKGAPAAGAEHRHPLNGPWPDAAARPGDPPPPPPPPNPAAADLLQARSVVFLLAAPGAIGNFFGPMPVRGEQVEGGYHSG